MALGSLPFLLTALFLLVASRDLLLPGLYADEVIQIAPALLQAFGTRANGVHNGLPGSGIPLLPRRGDFPLMTIEYLGSLKTLLFIPVARLFGSSTTVIRLFTLAIAACAVFATYRFTARAFSSGAALVATLLLALDQSFILRTKVDWGPNALALACKMIALAVFVRWWRSRHAALLAAVGVILGLGLYNKTDFAWVLLTLAAATILVYPRELRRALTPGNVAAGLGGFVVGAIPFIIYNLRDPLASFRRGNPEGVRWYDPAILRAALGQRVQLLIDLLDGRSLDGPIGITPAAVRPFSFGTPFAGIFAVALLAALAVALLPQRRVFSPRFMRGVRWLLICMGVFFACAVATPGASGHHHILNIYPFPHLLVGVMLADGTAALNRNGRQRLPLASLGAGVILLALVASNLALLDNTSRALQQTGGTGRWSDAIYGVADDLRQRPADAPIYAMDWGIQWRLSTLLEGRVSGIEEPWVALINPAAASDTTARLLANPRAEYIVALPGTVAFPTAWQAMQEYATQRGYRLEILRTYYQRDGVPTLQRCRFLPATAMPAASQVHHHTLPGDPGYILPIVLVRRGLPTAFSATNVD